MACVAFHSPCFLLVFFGLLCWSFLVKNDHRPSLRQRVFLQRLVLLLLDTSKFEGLCLPAMLTWVWKNLYVIQTMSPWFNGQDDVFHSLELEDGEA